MGEILLKFLWFAFQPALYILPVVLVGYSLPRRDHFLWRCIGCYTLMALYLSLKPEMSLVTSTLSAQESILIALFYSGILVLNTFDMLICHETTLRATAFCAVVGYTLENLGSSLSTLFGILAGNPDCVVRTPADILLTRAFWCMVVYVVYIVLVMRTSRDISFLVKPSKMAFTLVFMVMFFNIVFDIVTKQLYHIGIPMGYSIILRLTMIIVCNFSFLLEYEVLLRQQVQDEARALEHLMQAREAQYQLSHDTIESVNMKMHDIRHQIRNLEEGLDGTRVVDKTVLDDIAREVNVYDTHVKTGNEALDTVLSEKALLGEREGITLSCIADGKALDFMSPTDLYSLFGNAIENAFEAVRKVDDPEKRNISLLVRRAAGMVSIHVENYYAGNVKFREGLPVTSKSDAENHGYGTKSMVHTAEKYGGALTVHTEGQIYQLNILIPIP